jgi:hypothetical protein
LFDSDAAQSLSPFFYWQVFVKPSGAEMIADPNDRSSFLTLEILEM